jgi:uncharacterized protein
LSKAHRIPIGGMDAIPDLSGALYLPEVRTLVVADLHLEKASSLARRGAHLPPYDTRVTLDQLAGAIAAVKPERLVFLGDSFHDARAGERIAAEDLATLTRLAGGQETIWIAGNHDPEPVLAGSVVATSLSLGPLTLRHEPRALADGEHEIAGHLHPAAAVVQRGRRLRCKCFIADGRRLLLPAFGSFTGGLDVLTPVIAGLFAPETCHAWLIGATSVHRFPLKRLS